MAGIAPGFGHQVGEYDALLGVDADAAVDGGLDLVFERDFADAVDVEPVFDSDLQVSPPENVVLASSPRSSTRSMCDPPRP